MLHPTATLTKLQDRPVDTVSCNACLYRLRVSVLVCPGTGVHLLVSLNNRSICGKSQSCHINRNKMRAREWTLTQTKTTMIRFGGRRNQKAGRTGIPTINQKCTFAIKTGNHRKINPKHIQLAQGTKRAARVRVIHKPPQNLTNLGTHSENA